MAPSIPVFGDFNTAEGIGINSMRLGVYESTAIQSALDFRTYGRASPITTKYGSTPGLLADAVALGVTVLRQPVSVDLTWPQTLAIPVDPDQDGRALAEALDASELQERGASRSDSLAALFYQILSIGPEPQRVVLTFLNIRDSDGMPADPLGEYLDGSQAGANTLVKLTWSEDHLTLGKGRDRTVPWGPVDYSIDEVVSFRGGDLRTVSDWTFVGSTLDPRSPYKLQYVYLLGRAFGRILLTADAALQALWSASPPAWWEESQVIPSLFDALLAIELCNEVSSKNVVVAVPGAPEPFPFLGALGWMRVAREGLRGIREELGSAGVAVDFWLPSLLSTGEDSAESTASDKGSFAYALTFATDLAWWIRWWPVLADPALFPADCNDDSLMAAQDGFTNQDYHWYHYAGTSGQPTARLWAQVRALREVFEEVGLNEAVGRALTVSVCESGAAVGTDEVSSAYPSAFGIAENDGGTSSVNSDDSNLYPYQAAEVWRRLGTALSACGYVMWQTHMSDSTATNAFRGMGLRVDAGVDTADAADAQRRPSWYAYRRLTQILGGARARLVLPGRGTSSYFQDLDPADPDDMTLVLEFELEGFEGLRYGYLLLVDPCSVPEIAASGVAVGLSGPVGVETWLVPTVPEAVVGHGGDSTTLPGGTASWPRLGVPRRGEWKGIVLYPGPNLSARSVRYVVPYGDPTLLLTSAPLEVT